MRYVYFTYPYQGYITKKMVHDSSLLNTDSIEGKEEQSREMSNALLYTTAL